MCGIIGGTKREWDYHAATQSLIHRGPDNQQVVNLPDLSLGFARLAIIDLSEKADQPMCNTERNVWIVFNGEIYGFKDLRKELESSGHRFLTTSDTEVVLQAYLHWGDSFVEHIDGMFAIALHDQRTRTLKLFRDRVGIKPLYYFFNGRDFAFASELKAITTLCQDVSFQVDHTALYDYLTYRYIPEPKTLYKNTFKLPPAHTLTFDSQRSVITSCRPYWSLPTDVLDPRISAQEAGTELRKLIQKSIKDQMIADVPVGFFLSGGMDSSTVVFESHSLNAFTQTFTIGFDQETHNEIKFAKTVADAYHTDHHVEILSGAHTEDLFARMKGWFDEPFADTSAYPTFLVSKFAKQKVTVVLTGDGGDEIFGGYRWYKVIPALRRIPGLDHTGLNKVLSHVKSLFPIGSFLFKVFNQFDLFTCDDLACYIKLIGGMTSMEKKPYAQKWGIPEDYDSYWYIRKFYRPDLPLKTRLQYMDFHTYLPSDILTKVDRTSMSVSLESRVPLLSKDIVEFCFTIPEPVRYYQNRPKGLLKEAYKDFLPEIILNRGKQGFSIPKIYLNQENERYQERLLKELFPY